MEITYFALGMLSMLALLFIGVIVWGLVKVLRIERHIVAIKENNRFNYDSVQRQFEDIYRRFDDSNLNRDNLWREANDKFDKIEHYEKRRFDELLTIIYNKFDESISYTDKRIDKSLNQKEVL